MNVGIILAAGISTRFNKDIFKQMYSINGKRMIEYSIDAMYPVVDNLIIVVNSKCNFSSKLPNVIVLVNDIPDRKASIQSGIRYLENFKSVAKVIIHDSARPFVTSEHFRELLKFPFAQYYLVLTNGLFCISEKRSVSRDNYIELCTPVCMDYSLLPKTVPDEWVDVIDGDKHFIEGIYSFLKKITIFQDI